MARYLQYLPVLLAAAGFLIVGAFAFVLSQRALERSPKSLAWIKRHGAGGYPFAREAFPDKAADWLCVFGVAVFALVVSMVFIALRVHAAGTGWLSGLFSANSLFAVAVDILGAICMYFLLQRLFGSTAVSACGSLLFAASFVGAHTAGALLAVSLLLLFLWLTAAQERLFPAELLYWAACLVYCVTLSLRPQLLPVAALYLGLHLYKHIDRVRRDEQSVGALIGALGLGLLIWAIGALGYVVARLGFFYGFSAEMLRSQLFASPMTSAARMLRALLRHTVQPFSRGRALLPLMDAPLLGLGGFGAIAALLLILRRKDPRGIFALLILAATVLVWLLSDESVLFVGLTLPCALLFSNFERGRKRAPIVLFTLLGVAYYIALYLATYLAPLSESIRIRLS